MPTSCTTFSKFLNSPFLSNLPVDVRRMTMNSLDALSSALALFVAAFSAFSESRSSWSGFLVLEWVVVLPELPEFLLLLRLFELLFPFPFLGRLLLDFDPASSAHEKVTSLVVSSTWATLVVFVAGCEWNTGPLDSEDGISCDRDRGPFGEGSRDPGWDSDVDGHRNPL